MKNIVKPNDHVHTPLMPNTMTEAQIKTAARKIARQASRLRAKGDHDAANKMVAGAAANVAAMRARGEVA